MLITVFTPTYNRGYILPKLYESLCRQTMKDFEWVVIDDGSKDNTKELFDNWVLSSPFSIQYHKVENGGKHRAINYGVQIGRGILFYIVDSDDYLPEDALAVIATEWNKVKDREDTCGVCGLRISPKGEKIGGGVDFGQIYCNSLDFRYKHKIVGDMAEVFRTEVIRRYPFPEIQGENFCPEALVWQRIAKNYKFHYFFKGTYICEYLDDGLTAKITKLRMQCPVGSTICYSELTNAKVPFYYKLRASINYWRFWFCPSQNNKASINPLWIIAMPLGWLMHIKDKRSLKN